MLIIAGNPCLTRSLIGFNRGENSSNINLFPKSDEISFIDRYMTTPSSIKIVEIAIPSSPKAGKGPQPNKNSGSSITLAKNPQISAFR